MCTVADKQPGKRNELLLAGAQAGATGTEDGVESARQALDPRRQAEFVHRTHDCLPRNVGEQRDVVGERPREELGALGDDTDRATQLLQVDRGHVDVADEDGARRRLDRA